ncbi:arrestin domain-containing protein 3-like [Cololabis saira]|uniref:arrestin domain-containing protein 3-like n=1 Tax=Cololabis saira TaxID=129043 RepID=UPI002AD5ACEC|nr:arrestin domain-containing protein 3-like [Cololabis saira]
MFERAIKNFNIALESLNIENAVSAGDLLTGQINFDLMKETNISSLSIKLKGGVHVHWTTGGKRKRHHSAKLKFFNIKSAIIQGDNAIGGGTKLAPGRHLYPFSFQIPQGDFPSSFNGPHGEISYKLTVSINRPWHLSQDFVTMLNFVNRIDSNNPDLWAPLSGSSSKTLCCLWCTSGPIEMTATMERKAFIPGETAKIICDISNASSRTVIPKVILQQKHVYYLHDRVQRRPLKWYLAAVHGDPIGAHTSHAHVEIMLDIPSSASLSLTNCPLLEVFYIVKVSLHINGSSDLTVLFPITLCNTSAQMNRLH